MADTPRERIVCLLLMVLAQPYRYSRKDLAAHFQVHQDTIKSDLVALRGAGLEVNADYNNHYRLAILPDFEFKELKALQPLSEEDKATISRALDHKPSTQKVYLLRKIESLYDFQQLGIRALRKPALERLDRLKQGQKEERQVILENYRSRSNNIRDRLVEPFHIDPDKDTLQAYDVEAGDSRHFRLLRIERVRLTDRPWQFQNHHRSKITDVFRIVDNQQINVHLTIDVWAYNSLTEEFPLTRTYLEPGSDPNTWDLQCPVNQDFKGLLNFILSNAEHVDIHTPDVLRARVRSEGEKIWKKFQ